MYLNEIRPHLIQEIKTNGYVVIGGDAFRRKVVRVFRNTNMDNSVPSLLLT